MTTVDPVSGPFGGLLADEMGLGKTLTTLATIVSTLKHAKATTTADIPCNPSDAYKRPSHATLIVVPSESRVPLNKFAVLFTD